MNAGLLWTIVGALAGVAAVIIAIVQLRQSRRSGGKTPPAGPPDEQAGSPDQLVPLSPEALAAVATFAVKITAVSPQKGERDTIVKIFGYGFNDGANYGGGSMGEPDVTFNGLAAGVLGGWTDKQVSVRLPRGLPMGSADLRLITPDGEVATLPNAFELYSNA